MTQNKLLDTKCPCPQFKPLSENRSSRLVAMLLSDTYLEERKQAHLDAIAYHQEMLKRYDRKQENYCYSEFWRKHDLLRAKWEATIGTSESPISDTQNRNRIFEGYAVSPKSERRIEVRGINYATNECMHRQGSRHHFDRALTTKESWTNYFAEEKSALEAEVSYHAKRLHDSRNWAYADLSMRGEWLRSTQSRLNKLNEYMTEHYATPYATEKNEFSTETIRGVNVLQNKANKLMRKFGLKERECDEETDYYRALIRLEERSDSVYQKHACITVVENLDVKRLVENSLGQSHA